MSEVIGELLRRCRNGEVEAFSLLVEQFGGWARQVTRAILRDEHLAEDAVQASFLKAFMRLGELREPAAFPGWFRQILRSESCRIARSRREPVMEDFEVGPERGPGPPERMELEDMRQKVREAVNSLPDNGRQTTELYYLGGHNCEEVAKMLQVPEGTVKRRLHDARNHLRTILGGVTL